MEKRWLAAEVCCVTPLPCSSANQPAGSGKASRTTRVRKLLTKDRGTTQAQDQKTEGDEAGIGKLICVSPSPNNKRG